MFFWYPQTREDVVPDSLSHQPSVRAHIDWGLLAQIAAIAGGGEAIHRYLAVPVNAYHFRQEEATKPYYGMVASFLDEGWKDQESYRGLLPEVGAAISLEDFGRIMNRLVSGCRCSQAQAHQAGATWVGEGEWPTRRDTAAFLYFRAMNFR